MPVLVDLTSAPGRTVVFTRTKHGAKALARQLNSPACPRSTCTETSARTHVRDMEMFHSGKATTLVATDIAARGIHVDDVALVIHADPPTEHKAYLHRSGRTARAGAEGTVITLMTDDQVRDVRDLTRLAGIKPTTTKVHGPGHAMLEQLAPGARSTPGGLVVEVATSSGGGGRSNGANAQRKRPAAPARPTASRVGQPDGRLGTAPRPAARPVAVAVSVVAPAAARVARVRAARAAVAPAARADARAAPGGRPAVTARRPSRAVADSPLNDPT